MRGSSPAAAADHPGPGLPPPLGEGDEGLELGRVAGPAAIDPLLAGVGVGDDRKPGGPAREGLDRREHGLWGETVDPEGGDPRVSEQRGDGGR